MPWAFAHTKHTLYDLKTRLGLPYHYDGDRATQRHQQPKKSLWRPIVVVDGSLRGHFGAPALRAHRRNRICKQRQLSAPHP